MARIGRPRTNPEFCISPGCGRKAVAFGYCNTHYKSARAGRNPDLPIRPKDVVDVTGTRVTLEVKRKMKRWCQETGMGEYELVRRVLQIWADQQPPAPAPEVDTEAEAD